MRIVNQLAGAAAALAVLSFAWTPASAANVIFVAATNGNDGTCTGDASSPCRTLSFALSLAGSGDVVQLESGGNYFNATVTQSVKIYSPHGAAIFGSGPCLTINAGASDEVTVDGIVCIPGAARAGAQPAAVVPITTSGIVFNSGKKLRVRNSRIHDAPDANCGILFRPKAAAELEVERTLVSENGGSGTTGGAICVVPSGTATVSGVIDHLTSQNNQFGLIASSSVTAKINLLVQNSTFSNNIFAIRSTGAGSVLRVTGTSIYQNNNGVQSSSGGSLISMGDNVLAANGVNGAFTATEARQ